MATKNKATLYAALIVAFVSACATEINHKHIDTMNKYVGLHERDLIQVWGIPDKTYQLDRRTKVISYVREAKVFSPGGGFNTCIGAFPSRFGYSGCYDATPTTLTRTYCEYNFNIVNSTVQSWFQNGNDCPRIR